jgi:bacteriophage exclusion system BrxB-like protein
VTQQPLFSRSALDDAVQALAKDLLAEGGPQISTMRNYRFAILPYLPQEEFPLRQRLARLVGELRAGGWGVLSLSLQKLLLDRVRAMGDADLAALVASEKRLFQRDPGRALEHLRTRIAAHVEGADGIAADVARLIGEFADSRPDDVDRTVVFIGRAGALYPFYRSSALLKHIDGRTRNISVVLLYPGERREGGLSFMGELPPDRDYRPRIYP